MFLETGEVNAVQKTLETLLSDLPGASLEEVAVAAQLMTRVDRKYVIRLDDDGLNLIASIVDEVGRKHKAAAQEIDGVRTGEYRSIYFDTLGNLSFLTAVTGHPYRWKVRTREYLTSGHSFVEVKYRDGGESTSKVRVPAEDEATEFVAKTLRDVGAGDVGPLQPALTTRYHRGTILLPEEESRVTIDVSLSATSFGGDRLDYGNVAVIETKTPTSKGSKVDRLLFDAGLRPTRFSKYATSRALIDRRLPRKRWEKVIRGWGLDQIEVTPSGPIEG